MKIMGNWCGEGVVGQGVDAAGLDHGGAASVLDFALDGKEEFLGNGEAPLFEELGGNNGVGDAGFIFEADKDESLRGAGALAADDHSCDANVLPISGLRQIARQGHVVKLLADESHGVASCGHASAGKIGIETLKGIHRSKGRRGLDTAVIETGQILRAMRRFDFPESVAAVFDQAIERADAGQHAKRRFVGGDAILKVLQRGKRPLGPCRRDSPADGGIHSLDHGKS